MSQRRFPTFPIPSVGAVIVGAKGVLLIKRDKPPFMGLWNIPTGVINVGETQEEAVLREVREETGITGDVLRFLDTGDVILKDQNEQVEYHFVVNVYLIHAESHEFGAGSGPAEVAWFNPKSLPSGDMVDSVHKALRAMENQLLKLMRQET
ncbi:MAG: NUDIX hydrolase [Candidatus Thorarchaeota archaeon]